VGLSRSIGTEQVGTYRAYNNTVEQPFMSVLSFMNVLRHSVFHCRRMNTFEVATVMQSATKH